VNSTISNSVPFDFAQGTPFIDFIVFLIEPYCHPAINIDRGTEHIAVEIKTFAGESLITDYHADLGQFLNYRLALELTDSDRTLYLAVPALVYESFFQREFLRISIERYQIPLIIYEPLQEVIEQWIK
jgi:XisH protein